MRPLQQVGTLLLAWTVTVSATSNSNERLADQDSIARILNQSLADSGSPGIGAVVASSDGIVDVAVIGVKRLGTKTPLEPESPFHIGSVTKPFTATVVARLVEAGSLTWEMPVADVLPEVVHAELPVFQDITLAHLLAHEGGLKPMEEETELAEVPELKGGITAQRHQFAEWIFRQPPTVTPMTEYRYSNAHFVVAASMAEAVTGKSWEELVKEHVFSAFSMTNAGFGWAGKQGENVPWGHLLRDGEFRLVDPNGDYQLPPYFAPAGDIHASLPDMARFFQGLLMSWQGKGNYLKSDTLKRMLTRRLRSGLGWGVTEAFGFERVATYSGSADTFLMVVVLIPDADLGVAVVANAYSEKVERAVVQTLRGIVDLHVSNKERSRNVE